MISCHLQIMSFISSFSMWMPSVSFWCLIAVARTSSTMLSNSGERASSTCSWSWRKSFQLFTSENDPRCGLIIYGGLSYIEVCSLYTHFIESFYHKLMLILSRFLHLLGWSYDFFLHFVNVVSVSHLCVCWTLPGIPFHLGHGARSF